MAGVRLTVSLHGLHAHYPGEPRRVIEVAQMAEACGIDCVSLPDHVVMGTRVDRYPYGPFPMPEEFPWFEPLTVLSAVAVATQRIRLTTSVLIAPLRPAVLLAKIAATLDQLSAGRLELGLGTGWQREEHAAAGVSFATRAQRLVDTVRACRALWRGERQTFASATVRFDDVLALPRPCGEIPLWFGMAATPAALSSMAECDAGWVPMAVDPGKLAAGIEALRAAYAAAGRDPAAVRVRAGLPLKLGAGRRPDLAATLDGIAAAAAVGVTDVEIFAAAFVGRAADVEPVLREVASRRA